jgi:V-type H+-transporting ATPase subunit C
MNPQAWFIAAPGSPSKQETIKKLSESFKKNEFADIFPFAIPDFKVGTLDSLIVLSEELVKSDILIEQIVLKLSDSLKSMVKNDELYKQNLLVNDSKTKA